MALRICKKCNQEFDTILRGETWREDISCNRHYCFNCLPFKAKANVLSLERIPNSNEKHCKKCNTIKLKTDFTSYKNGISGYCKECRRTDAYKIAKINKEWVVNLKGGCCEKCGYSKSLNALEFHHIDRNKKDLTISGSNLTKKNMEKIKIEIEKCILLCANCHRELHEEMGYRY